MKNFFDFFKRKKLKQKISELESEKNIAKIRVDGLERTINEIILELHENGVEYGIKLPKRVILNAETLEDTGEHTCYGRTTEQPKIEFDFSKHDAEVLERQKHESNP